MIRFRIFTMTVCLLVGFAYPAFGTLILRFEGITSKPEDTPEDIENQAYGYMHLFADVIDQGQNQVLFRFRNTDPAATPSSITRVYFDDDVFKTGSTCLDSPLLDNSSSGVDFTFAEGFAPPRGNNLVPSWNNSDTDYAAFSTPSNYHNGVNSPSEYFGIEFTAEYVEVESALENGSLRIALHVQSFPENGRSMSFINTPEPGMLLLLSIGGLVLGKRKKVESNVQPGKKGFIEQ